MRINALIALSIVSILVFFSGSTGSINVSNAIDGWNSWIEVEYLCDHQFTEVVSLIDKHLDEYNDEIVKDSPNYDMLRNMYRTDMNNLDGWTITLDKLNVETSKFAEGSAGLSGDSKIHADDMLSNMRAYHDGMSSAQANLIGYCNDMITYINSYESGCPDESILDHANDAKDSALDSIEDGVDCGYKAMDDAYRLNGLQTSQSKLNLNYKENRIFNSI